MNIWVEPMYGKLKGLWLEVIDVQYRYNNCQGHLYLCETGSGRKYWLRSINVRPLKFLGDEVI